MNELFLSELDVWVLAGQSNMQGCGLFQGASTPDERVWCFTSAGQWEIAEEPLHRLWESITPVNQGILRPQLPEEVRDLSDVELASREAEARKGYLGLGATFGGAGLGISFGTAMAEATGRKIGLIAAAHGGTSLEQWSHTHKEAGGASLYGAMIERIRLAGGRLRGVLWYQGESDCDPAQSVTYLQRMQEWIAAVRADTGQSELPVIIVQLSRVVADLPPEIHHSWDRIRQAQATLPHRMVAVGVVGAIDLGLADSIHVDTLGLIRLGKRMAKVALAMKSNPHHLAGPEVVSVEDGSFRPGMAAILLRCRGVSGGLNPRSNMGGFVVCDDKGSLHPTLKVIDASPELDDPTIIRVLLNGPISPGIQIGYGLGCNPYCNAVDEADMPLLAFSPRAIDT